MEACSGVECRESSPYIQVVATHVNWLAHATNVETRTLESIINISWDDSKMASALMPHSPPLALAMI